MSNEHKANPLAYDGSYRLTNLKFGIVCAFRLSMPIGLVMGQINQETQLRHHIQPEWPSLEPVSHEKRLFAAY